MGVINLVTELPGPRSRQLLAEAREHVIGAWNPPLIEAMLDHAEGAVLHDVDDNTLLDFTGGIGCLNVGHSHPHVVAAIREAATKFLHTDWSIVPYPSLVRLAERLGQVVPIDGPTRAAFFNSGAEAVENAVKIARQVTGRKAVITFHGAFHGRTLMAMSLTSKIEPYKKGMGPFAPEVYRIPFGNPYRCPLGKDAPAYSDSGRCEDCTCGREGLETAFLGTVDPADVACVVVEPVQGEGGFVMPRPEFLRDLQAVCREHGIVFVVDEVQTGFGRCGTLFASEHYGIEPDLICLAKSIAAGLPLSAVVGRAEIMDRVADSSVGGTFGGNPIACAAAHAVLDVLLGDDAAMLAHGQRIGDRAAARFAALAERYDFIGDVRNVGPMVAMEFVVDRETKAPDASIASQLLSLAFQRGLCLLKAGLYGNVVRLLVTLAVTEDQLDEGLDVIEACLADVHASRSATIEPLASSTS